MSEEYGKELEKIFANDSVKELAYTLKKVDFGSSSEIDEIQKNREDSECTDNTEYTVSTGSTKYTTNTGYTKNSQFKVVGTNLPAKPSIWTKFKNALFSEIKVQLTPYQQKIENEINEYLHQEITWKSLKEAALSEVPITFMGKRIF